MAEATTEDEQHQAQPLDGLLVVDFSQFLSGPSASLRLADLGARVIKVERPGVGDICRTLYVSETVLDGESTVFHAINRNKESIDVDLSVPGGDPVLDALVRRADVVMHNFRPGVIDRLGYSYERVQALNPHVVYGEISGYGTEGEWRSKPGQDLLLQAMSGLTWLSGSRDAGPVPFGLAIVDLFAGSQLVQGVLACLVRRGLTGVGGRVEVSMLEAALDLQFEALTLHLDGEAGQTVRSALHHAHPHLGAPYGVYPTADGYLALAMTDVPTLGHLLGCPALGSYADPGTWVDQRDAIQRTLGEHLREEPTAFWLDRLEPADVWCAEVLDWPTLRAHDGYRILGMEQTVRRGTGAAYRTTRCPIRFNGEALYADRGSPVLGEHSADLAGELFE